MKTKGFYRRCLNKNYTSYKCLHQNKCIINKDNILNQIEDVYKKIDELNNYLFGSAFINVYKSRVDSIKRNININSNC